MGAWLLTGLWVYTAAPRIKHFVELLQRGQALAGVAVVQAPEVLGLSAGFVHHAGINGLVGRLGECRGEVPGKALHQTPRRVRDQWDWVGEAGRDGTRGGLGIAPIDDRLIRVVPAFHPPTLDERALPRNRFPPPAVRELLRRRGVAVG